jgi:alanine dehydrogenase
MLIGVVKEIKTAERRCALTPDGTRELTRLGHSVLVETGAGDGSGFSDAHYADAGATIAADASSVWTDAELLLKVKEPTEPEYSHLREGQILFTYLHLAANPELVSALIASGTTAVAYETIEDGTGGLPLLRPMSEIAGRLAPQAGAYFLQQPMGGSGVLIGGAPGVAPASVLVIGGGVVGTQAARVASGMGADVTILDTSLRRLRELDELFDGRVRALMSTDSTIEDALPRADVVIGAVLIPGAAAPRLVSRDMLSALKQGTVLVDVAIDQGGSFETSRATTHTDPTYEVDGIVHYCVANMPGAVPRTSTRALTNATFPYVRKIAGIGLEGLCLDDAGVVPGVNVRSGEIVYRPVADAYREKVAATA